VNPTVTGGIVGAVAGLAVGYGLGEIIIGDDPAKFRKRKAIPQSMPTGEILDEMVADRVAVLGVLLIVGGLIGASVAGPTYTPPQVATVK
jgi:hypothetical protein